VDLPKEIKKYQRFAALYVERLIWNNDWSKVIKEL